jgi:hypothetical protein
MIIIRRERFVRSARGKRLRVIVAVHVQREQQLAFTVFAARAPGLFFGSGERRQQHGGQNRDDRDDHQEFDQRESPERGGAAGK